MIKQTPDVAQALVNLRGNKDFQVFLKWLEASEAKDTQLCVEADGLKLYQSQGSVKTLQAIAKAEAEAPDLLKKFT